MTTVRRPTSPFVRGYLECALWSSTDESRDDGGDPLDQNYDVTDFSVAAQLSAERECAAFCEANAADLEATGADMSTLGHDLWLTRNRHGAGFWDRNYPDGSGERLTTAAVAMGERHVYISPDMENGDQLHFMEG